jgi:hypothetical protein
MHKKGLHRFTRYSIRFEDTKMYYDSLLYRQGYRCKHIEDSSTYKTEAAAKGQATKLGFTNYTVRPSQRVFPNGPPANYVSQDLYDKLGDDMRYE